MYLTKIYNKPDLYLRGLKTNLWDAAGFVLLKDWEKIEKDSVETVDDSMLPKILRIQADGFKTERQAEIIKYSKKFRNVFYVVKSRDQVLGYCIYHLKPAFSSCELGKKSVIYSIAIDRKFRNMGFGRKLLQESIREMKLNGVLSILLYVDINNTPAIKLYRNTGFYIVKEVKDICGQNERCYKMELRLY